MKQYNSMYLGVVINNNDPEKRGRVQVFVPHIMPALYENWNKEGKDIQINCVGDNMINGITSDMIYHLSEILPWAESASPIVGSSSTGNLITSMINGVKGIFGLNYDQSPAAEPANITDLGGLFDEASKWVGSDDRGSKVKDSWGSTRGPGNCLRGTQGILGALTGHPRFNAGKAGGLGSYASLYSTKGGQDLTGTGLYDKPVSVDSNYMSDPSQWQVGDTVASSGGKEGYGHIQVWTGKAWVSDFTQSKILPASNSGSYSNFALHRPNEAGKARIAERAGSLMGESSQTAPLQQHTSVSGEVAAANPHSAPTPSSVTDESSPETYGNAADPTIAQVDAGGPDSIGATTYGGITTDFTTFLDLNPSERPPHVKQMWESKGYNIAKNEASMRARGMKTGTLSMADTRRGAYGQLTENKTVASTRYPGGSVLLLKNPDGSPYDPTGKNPSGRYTVMDTGNASATYRKVDIYTDTPEAYSNLGGVQVHVESIGSKTGPQYKRAQKMVAEGKLPPNDITPSNAKSSTGLVMNPNPHGGIVTQNLNNAPRGLFTFPAAGAMVWIFFREGNPMFPVYFAASYSQNEWKSAYRGASDCPGYRPASTEDNPVTSTGGIMNLNGVGGIRWEETNNEENRLQDQKSIMFFGEDGSNIFMGKGYNQYFSKFDRRDQVEGDRWETTLGFKEEWLQGDMNQVVMGDVFVKIGNVSQPAVDATQRIQELLKEIQQPLSESSS